MPYSYNKSSLPLLNYETTIWQFCVCHDTPNSRPGVNWLKLKKRSPFWSPQVLPSLELSQAPGLGVLFLLPAYPAPHWPAFFPRNGQVAGAAPRICTHYLHGPHGEPGIPCLSWSSWSLGCHWAQHLGVWSRWQEAVRLHESASRQT